MDESTDWTLDALVACGVIAATGFVGGVATAAHACPPADSAEAHAPPAWRQVWDDSRQWAAGVLGQVQARALGESLPADGPALLSYLPPQPESSAADPWRAMQPCETLPSRLVVLVHGLDESGFVWDDLAPALASQGLTVLRFDYANDQAARLSADQLQQALASLSAHGVKSVSLVGHSLGGLICRDVATRPPASAGPQITRLVMLSSPHRGSPLVALQPLGEARDQLSRSVEGTSAPGEGWLHSTRDGRGEAARDLMEGSAYLADLNSREFPPELQVTNIVGRMVSGSERARVRSALQRGLGEVLDADAGRRVISMVDQAMESLGDGLVSTESATLPGIADTIEVKGNHRTMIRRWRLPSVPGGPSATSGDLPGAIPVIVNRLVADQAQAR